MFEVGDLILYGSSGVCRVEKIGAPNFSSWDGSKPYYTLTPVFSTETIYAPVDTAVYMRPILSKEEAEELVAQIPYIRGDVCASRNLTMLKEQYEASIQAHRCEDLVGLIKSIYVKNQNAVSSGRKIGQVDQRYMKRAEDLLYGELAVALGIDREEVVAYIEKAAQQAQPVAN